jgi:predicted nuclease of predicted toxin-antitoxin system
MKFLADECCDAPLVDALRQDGHDVLYAVESLRGATDDELLACAFSEQRFLVTEDKDFGELIYRLRRQAHGIVLLRFDIVDRHLKIPRLRYLLAQAAERLPDALVVLEADKIRFRPLRID